jgi:hypothetical protein
MEKMVTGFGLLTIVDKNSPAAPNRKFSRKVKSDRIKMLQAE